MHVHPISLLKCVEVWQIISQWMIQMFGGIPQQLGGGGCGTRMQSLHSEHKTLNGAEAVVTRQDSQLDGTLW